MQTSTGYFEKTSLPAPPRGLRGRVAGGEPQTTTASDGVRGRLAVSLSPARQRWRERSSDGHPSVGSDGPGHCGRTSSHPQNMGTGAVSLGPPLSYTGDGGWKSNPARLVDEEVPVAEFARDLEPETESAPLPVFVRGREEPFGQPSHTPRL